MRSKILAVMITLGAFWLASAAAAQETTAKQDEDAKVVAEKFTKAFVVDTSVDSVMKLVAAPYLQIGSGDPRDEKAPKVINNLDDVRKFFVKILEGRKSIEGKLTFQEVISYESLMAKEKVPPEMRKILDEVMKNSDRMVKMRLNSEDGGYAEVISFVSWRDGQPKVVGYRLGFAKGVQKK
jgi:hypothetical protein